MTYDPFVHQFRVEKMALSRVRSTVADEEMNMHEIRFCMQPRQPRICIGKSGGSAKREIEHCHSQMLILPRASLAHVYRRIEPSFHRSTKKGMLEMRNDKSPVRGLSLIN